MRRTDEAGKEGKDGRGGDVEGFGAPERLRRGVRVLLLSLMRSDEGHDGPDEARRRRVVAEVGQEVVVQLPEHVQSDAAVRRRNIVIRLSAGCGISNSDPDSETFSSAVFLDMRTRAYDRPSVTRR